MNHKAERKPEDDFYCAKKNHKDEILITSNQKFVIEINEALRADEDDLELSYSRYPSTEYEIPSIDKIIKDEEEDIISKSAERNVSRPKTYKITINMRDTKQSTKFRKDLLGHYKRCIVTGKSNQGLIDAAHIMPFKKVGDYARCSSLKTGFLLRKEFHFLWDKYNISIDPQTWIVYLSKSFPDDENYSKYHIFKLPDEIIKLLKVADFKLLKQYYEKFTDKMNGIKKALARPKIIIAKKKIIDEKIIIVERPKFIVLKNLSSSSSSSPKDDSSSRTNVDTAKPATQTSDSPGYKKIYNSKLLSINKVKNNFKKAAENKDYQHRWNMFKSIPQLRNMQNNLWGKNAKYSTRSELRSDVVASPRSVNTISNLGGLCLDSLHEARFGQSPNLGSLTNEENTNPIKLWMFHINNQPEFKIRREDDDFGKIYYLNMSIIIQSKKK
jgi:hypothetical protein